MSHCAVVFGGSRGIGRSIASHFLQNGMKVAIVSRNTQNIDTALSEFRNQVTGVTCDVTDEDAVKKILSSINSKFGSISVLVNAAGINKDSLLIKTPIKDIHEIVACNLIGSILTCKAVLRYMIPQGGGCIINIGSIIGSKGNIGQTIYSASKSGLVGFTKSLAKEVASRNIRVNLISPGLIETDMTQKLSKQANKIFQAIPLKRMGNADDVSHLANFLVDATYITGQVLYIDGGLHINF